MQALRYTAFGPPVEVLRFEDVPPPRLRAHEVLVRTRAVGINPLDWKLVEGQFRWFAKSRPPCGVGAEFAGEIIDAGAGVHPLQSGDRVAGWLNPFTEAPRALAERIAVAASQCVRVPDSVPLEVAAVIPVAGLSALQLLELIGARAGQRVLVHGAAGGVGSFVVAMLRDRGAMVCASGSADSQAFLQSLQPDACVDRSTPVATWPGPFDAVVDCATSLDRAALHQLLPHGGTVATTLPVFPDVVIAPALNPFRRIRSKTLRLVPEANRCAQVLALVNEGRLAIRLTRIYPFERSVDALLESRSGRARGKLAVAVA